MLRLQSCIVARLLSSSCAAPSSHLHRLLSAAAPAVSPSPPRFNAEEYLVERCGLTREQALKASAKLSHLKSPTNPDAVLAYLAGLGLSSADVSAAVSKDPQILCASVERTLVPVVAGLTSHGLSHTEIASLVSLGRSTFRCRSTISNLPYYVSLFGSVENLVRFFKQSSSLLGSSLEKVVKPNVMFLQTCGLGDCDIAKLLLLAPSLLTAKPERLQEIVACAEGLGVPRGSVMFKYALQAVVLLNEEKIAIQVENLKNTFRWSDIEVRIAISKLPTILTRSKDMLQSRSEFLISEVGLEPAYIAHRPAMLCYSLECRLKPRYYVVKFLKENGLLDHDRSYYTAVQLTEKLFLEKYINPHNEAAPYLAEDYTTTCKGEVPPRFKFA